MAPDPLRTARLPTGTVTFLFTDIEGSTRLLQRLGERYGQVLAEHRDVISAAVGATGGTIFGTEGDAVFAAFPEAGAAVRAAAEAQRGLGAHPWPPDAPLRVRMGLHTGDAVLVGGDYVGLVLHQVARIASAAHGGQVLLSEATRSLAGTAFGSDLDVRDLGEHRLKDLAGAERLFQLLGPDLAAVFPELRTLDVRPNNLPVQLTSFVGRDELESAKELLKRSRLLTLTGPGGTGKTRLALQLAADATDDFPDGVFFVALDAVTDPNLVPSAIAMALGLEGGSTPPLQRVVEHLRSHRTLLVLDNFEQVIDAGPLVSQILRDVAGVAIVVTSRVLLRAYGEQEFSVPPLALPDPQASVTAEATARSEAVRLFVERAMAADSTFRLTDANAEVVADIVRGLDGLPLAIELAAARIRVLPVEALRDRLGRRLAVLTGGARDRPGRQQTLRGAIDWSYDLLDPPDRRLFARFAVFSGGACLDEAETVCGTDLGQDTLDGLTSLAEKSLLRPVPGLARAPRFAMLATIREYALERLEEGGEGPALRERHGAAYRAMAERSADHLTGPRGRELLDRLELDNDNLRAVLDWAVGADDADTAFAMGAALWRFWQIRGLLDEAWARLESILAMPGGRELPPLLRARAFGAAGSVGYWRGNQVDAHRWYDLALTEARRTGDAPLVAEALYNSGFASDPHARTQDEVYRAGRPAFEESLRLFREIPDEHGVANALWALAITDWVDRDFVASRRRVVECIAIYERLDDSFGSAWAHHMLGLLDAAEGRSAEAHTNLSRAMRTFAAAGDISGIVVLLVDFSVAARTVGDEARMWRLAAACTKLRVQSGANLVLGPAGNVDWSLAEEPPPGTPGREAWDEGAAFTIDQAVAYALEGLASSASSTD